jgi:hypothetical protein
MHHIHRKVHFMVMNSVFDTPKDVSAHCCYIEQELVSTHDTHVNACDARSDRWFCLHESSPLLIAVVSRCTG